MEVFDRYEPLVEEFACLGDGAIRIDAVCILNNRTNTFI